MYHLRRTARPRERDEGNRRRRAAWRGRRPLVTLGLSKVTRLSPKGGRNPFEGEALAFCAVKPRHHIQSANVRIRCAIRTYDSITPGDYGFPHPDPLPRGEGANSRELQAGASEIKRKGAGQAPFDTEMQRWLLCVMWTRSRITTANGILTHVVPYRLVAAFIPSTNSFRRVSICSGFWWWVSMIFTTAEPEMAPAAPAAMASRT